MGYIKTFFNFTALRWKIFIAVILFTVSSALLAQQEIKVQRGVATVAGTTSVLSAPADFTAVSSLNNAFVRITNSQHIGAGHNAGGGNQNADDVTAQIQFNSVSQITITRIGAANNTRVCWEIIEYIGFSGGDNEFIVRGQGVHTFAAAGLSETLTFAGAASTTKLAGFVTGVANPDTGRNDYETGLVTTSFDDAATLRIDRANAGADAIQVSYAVVDFIGANWTVQRISHTYTAAGAVETEPTAVADNTTAFIHTQKRNVTDLRGLDEFGHQVWLSAANVISFQLRTGATDPAGQTSVAWIISNTDMSVARTNGTIAAGGGEPQTNNIAISAVSDLTNTSVFWNNDCNGAGRAYPRPIHAVRLTAVDNIEMWRSDTGQPQDYRYEIVEWPFTPFAIDGTIYIDEAKTTPIAAGKNVSLSVNGAAVTSVTTQAGGTFSFGFFVAPNANDVLLVFLDGEAEKASLVTITDGTTDFTGGNALSMVTDRIILEHQTGTSITNTNLDVIDAVDPVDGGITIAGGAATFAAGRELWITTGKNYAPGGNVTLTDIEIFGTITAGAYTFTINGSWNNNGGTFAAGTSTVDFTTAAAANIAGDTTFNDLQCTAVSKAITVEQGSTQTVFGKFLLNGNAFATRISLASLGGAGTTWNLVLNGTHDCRYVAVQGSTASGTAFFPINPVGFKNNFDNTNWYDSSLPTEMLFYDDFETSTLGSAPPDKASSHWNISTASWLTQAATVVNTQNHTAGGSQSMYSSGGASGQGIGVWNSPAWGPQTNCTAEAWFYDDMQNNKMQWLFIDNAAGNQGAGVLVETNQGQGQTKYRYCRFNFGGGTLYADSYIDRSLGWHKVTWVHTEGTLDLYLDGALLMTASGLSDFSAFDTGSWTWHNSTGSTPMWFDDFMVYRSQHQSAYRWYDNDSAQTPTALAALDTAISRDINTTTRLRVQIQDDQYEAWAGAYIGLQYREGSNGTWTDLGASADWNYADGLGTDGAQIANALLANTDIRQHFIESVPSSANLSMAYTEYGEWDFTLLPTANATIGATYYIRPVVTTPAGAFSQSFAAYFVVAECQVTSPTLKMWTGANSSDWNDPGNWAGSGVPDNTYDVIIPAGTPACRINIAGAACKSILVEDGASLLLDTASTDLTVSENVTVYGTVTHSDATATLTLNSGALRIEGATAEYNHSGNGTVNAANATIQVINGGSYNVSGAPTISAQTLSMSVGGLIDVTGAATFNVDDFSIDLNGQWLSSNTENTVNIANDFTNNGSMLGSIGGVFNFNGAGNTLAGSSTTTIFYQANFNSDTTVTMTNTITVIDDLVVDTGDFLTASTGTIKVGGDWINRGTFTHGSGTIELNGTALQQVTAAGSDFYNLVQTNASGAGVSFLDGFTATTLTNTAAGSTMIFNAGDIYNITGTGGLTLNGSVGNEITLASSAAGTYWHINPTGGIWSVDYVNVTDSVNIANIPILPTNSTNGGHNINWFSADQDFDDLPDYWEYHFYSSLVNNASSDTDSDTLNAFDEFILDTDPTVPISNILYVDCNAGYIGNGSASNPFKYLKEALDAASQGTLISLTDGVYTLHNYGLSKRVIIKGSEGAAKTIIRGAAPTGFISDKGQMLNVASDRFILSDVTLRLFRDDQPVVSYNVDTGTDFIVFKNLIFRDNVIKSKPILAPIGKQDAVKVYLLNSLFYANSALGAADLQGKDAKAYDNTLFKNDFAAAFITSGSGDTFITNNILCNANAEIKDMGTGTLTVSNCNIAGGYPGAIDSYDAEEKFIDPGNGYFRLLPGSAGDARGLDTFVTWDMDNLTRSAGSFDVGAYEISTTDTDNDGLTNAFEIANGYKPDHPDSDLDGLSDGEEIITYGTNPLSTNSDGDFIDDGDEPAMGMDPSVNDGVGDIDGVYYTSFENPALFPEGPVNDTIWGPNGNASNSNVIKGNMTIENVGAAAAYDGTHVAKCEGSPGGGLVETSYVGWVDRNGLDNYWISISYKMPRAELPTDLNEAMNVAGAFFAIDENGYLNIWDSINEEWLKDTQVIPDDWTRITVHRDHPGKKVNLWVETRQAFANVSIVDPDPTAGTGKFRMSMSSVGEQDSFTDLWSSLPFAPF